MAQDTINKRLGIATNAVIAATMILDGVRMLENLKEERTGLNFTQADFDGTDLQHLAAYDIGALLDIVGPDLAAWIDDAAQPIRKAILLNVRR